MWWWISVSPRMPRTSYCGNTALKVASLTGEVTPGTSPARTLRLKSLKRLRVALKHHVPVMTSIPHPACGVGIRFSLTDERHVHDEPGISTFNHAWNSSLPVKPHVRLKLPRHSANFVCRPG